MKEKLKQFLTYLLFIFIFAITIPSSFSYKTLASESGTGTWTRVKDMLISQYQHSAILLNNGKVLTVRCGYGEGEECAEIYDPINDTWTKSNLKTFGNEETTITKLDNGKILVTGLALSSASKGYSAMIYNEQSDEWTLTGNPVDDIRKEHTATLLPNGKVLAAGGEHSQFVYSDFALSSTEIYDPSNNAWSEGTPMHIGRSYHAAILLKNGKILVAGGRYYVPDGHESISSAEIYDYNSGSWTDTSSMLESREEYTATLLQNGKVLIAGGISEDVTGRAEIYTSAEIYDPETGQWSQTGSMINRRYKHTATLLSSGKVLVTGGWYTDQNTGEQKNLASAEIYDPAVGTWIPVNATMNSERYMHTATLLQDGRVFVAGGWGNGGVSLPPTAEIYDPGDVLGATAPPVPFLDLPWDYQTKGKTFNDAAMSINSYFDHSYPLHSSGLSEAIDGLNNILTFTNSFTDIGYSSHDGYDYGAQAGVIDGDPVLAAASGTATVVLAENSHGAGNVIKIDHSNGFQTWYEHLYPDELFVTSENDHKEVLKGQKIGKAGHFGNCWVLNKNGNRIYNTPACAHIHFSVFQDKEKVPDQEADFSDNIPSGVTDPFGWEPAKDLQPNMKDPDPWENFTFNQDGINKKGNKSNYLWLTRVNLAAMPIAVDGGEIVLGPDKFLFPPGVYAGNFNVYLSSSPFVNTKLIDKILKSVGPSIKAEARSLTGALIDTFFSPFTLIMDFSQASLYNIIPGSLSIYSSEDGITWAKELTTIDPLNHKATANINHFSFFALMGEVNDTDAPITEAIFTGDKGQENWYRSDVTVSLDATDDNLGVDYIYYKKQDEDWIKYSTPLTFTEEGNYRIQFYSGDKGRNVDDVKTITFSIDKTAPEADIKYDLTTFDTQVIGKDSAGSTNITVDKTAPLHPKYKVTDQAGNALLLNTDKIKLGKQVALSIKSMQYNSDPIINPDKNIFFTLVLTDKNNTPKQIDQYYSQKDDKKIFTNYLSSSDMTKIYTKTPGATTYTREDRTGIVLLQISTQNGGLKYSY